MIKKYIQILREKQPCTPLVKLVYLSCIISAITLYSIINSYFSLFSLMNLLRYNKPCTISAFDLYS